MAIRRIQVEPVSEPSSSVSPDHPRFRVGELMGGRYELQRLLGVGAMGEVWAAEDTRLQRVVALKTLRSDDPAIAERFVREARETAALSHPSIVRVFDFGLTPEKVPYLVLELLEGMSLGEVLRAGPISEEEAVMLGVRIADALAFAHERGLVHRDVKPDNIVFGVAGGRLQVKLVDFGLVKNVRGDGPRALTRNGMFVGTPEYVSPEQARGLELTGRTDVWSLGVVLYQALAGHVPFRGPTVMHCLQAVLREPLAPLSCSPELGALVARALSRDVGERIDAAELALALRGWLVARGLPGDAAGALADDFLPELPRVDTAAALVARSSWTSDVRSIPPSRRVTPAETRSTSAPTLVVPRQPTAVMPSGAPGVWSVPVSQAQSPSSRPTASPDAPLSALSALRPRAVAAVVALLLLIALALAYAGRRAWAPSIDQNAPTMLAPVGETETPT